MHSIEGYNTGIRMVTRLYYQSEPDRDRNGTVRLLTSKKARSIKVPLLLRRKNRTCPCASRTAGGVARHVRDAFFTVTDKKKFPQKP